MCMCELFCLEFWRHVQLRTYHTYMEHFAFYHIILRRSTDPEIRDVWSNVAHWHCARSLGKPSMKQMAATNIAIPLPFLCDACLRVQAIVPETNRINRSHLSHTYQNATQQAGPSRIPTIQYELYSEMGNIWILSVNSTHISKTASTKVSGDVW